MSLPWHYPSGSLFTSYYPLPLDAFHSDPPALIFRWIVLPAAVCCSAAVFTAAVAAAAVAVAAAAAAAVVAVAVVTAAAAAAVVAPAVLPLHCRCPLLPAVVSLL
jgi:hypothetical protein